MILTPEMNYIPKSLEAVYTLTAIGLQRIYYSKQMTKWKEDIYKNKKK